MKKYLTLVVALGLSALTANAVVVTIGATSTDWAATDFQTITPAQGSSGFDMKQNNTAGVVQSFTATSDMTVGAIHIMAQRWVADLDVGVDIYHFSPVSDAPSGQEHTYGANPDKIRLTNADRSTLIKSLTVNAGTGITSGNPGDNQLNIALDLGEQFSITTGEAYGVHIYSKAGTGSGDRLLIWNYANSDVYAGGTYGVDNQNVAARDLGLALTAVPEPATIALAFGLIALGGVIIRRRL